MPSGLARRTFQAQRFIRSVTETEQREVGQIDAASPFQGYAPDLNPEVLDLRFAHESRSVIEDGGDLVAAGGWEPLDADASMNHQLPFGGEVNRLDTFPRNDPMAGGVRTEIMAAVANTGTNAELWRFNPDASPAQWQEVTDTTADTGALGFSSGIFPDSFVFSNGVPGTVDEPVFVLCSLTDNVKFYPDSTSGIEYQDLIQTGGSGPSNFKARSGAVLAGRALYLHTEEGGTLEKRRLRGSVVGNAADLNGTGATTIDAVELEGEGLLVRPIGDHAVGYFTDGIVFYRRTGNELAPLEIEYVSKAIGCLSTHSVAVITEGLHFLATNNGWFLLNAAGELQEVGRLDVGEGKRIRKWTSTWFGNLNWDAADHIQVAFDPRNREILVAFPGTNSSENDRVWRYRLDTDTVWPDLWHESGASDLTANSFTIGPPGLTDVETWTESAGTSWTNDHGTWADLSSQENEEILFHGTRTGFVMAHHDGVVTRAQDHSSVIAPTGEWSSPWLGLNDSSAWKSAERFEIVYKNVGGGSATLGIETNDASGGSAQVSRSLSGGMAGTTQVASNRSARLGGTHHRVSWNAAAPFRIRRLTYRYRLSMGEKRNV